MKQKIYIFGLIATFLIFAGIVLKINHLAGAGKTMTIGFITMVLLFLPIALRNNFKSEGTHQNMPVYIVTWLTCFVVFTAALFKIMHWPFAGTLITIALPFPYVVFLPVFLAITAKNKNFSIYNTVFVLMLLVINSVLSGLLSLNVTRNRIDDSFNLSGNYIKAETVLNKYPEQIPDNQVIQSINEVLGTVDSYQEIIMKQENISPEQWKNNPETILRPDSKGLAARALSNSGENPAGTKLLSSLKDLVKKMEITPGLEEFSHEAPKIFDIVTPSGNEDDWYNWKFNDNNLSWVLIYLDGLEANLKMIKGTIFHQISMTL